MIKPPFTANQDDSVVVQDANGFPICEINPFLPDPFAVAQLLAAGANERLRNLEHLKEMAKKAGRPRHKKPGEFALAKRKERAKTKGELK